MLSCPSAGLLMNVDSFLEVTVISEDRWRVEHMTERVKAPILDTFKFSRETMTDDGSGSEIMMTSEDHTESETLPSE